MFHEKSMQEVIHILGSHPERGLTETEAIKRQKQYGRNVLQEKKKKTIGQNFLEQLNDPLIYILLVAAGISILLGEWNDAAIIAVVVVVNACVGVLQEGKARRALEALKKLSSPRALVIRDGKEKEIEAAMLVPGDIVCLETGRQVPADLRLTECVNLKIEEAALTGESLPVEKNVRAGKIAKALGDRKNMAFMSTNVTYGRGRGIVTAIGMQTELGKIASMINDTAEEATPLQKRLGDLGKILSGVAIFLCVALFIIAVSQQRNVGEMLITAISLAVAAVPEGLPMVVTIVLALSVTKMVKVNTIVRRLPSVETLGAVGVVCSDKTGTLTMNQMTVVRCFASLEMIEPAKLDISRQRELAEGMVLCNDAVLQRDGTALGDPTEIALLKLGATYNVYREYLETQYPRQKEKPFDSCRKMMTTLHRGELGYVSYTKGAPDEILKCCSHILLRGKVQEMTEYHRSEIRKAVAFMSGEALRVLALAMKKDVTSAREKGLIFVGMVGMMDPARPEVADAVRSFKRAHVKTVMITGDHIDTAYAIARELGIVLQFKECISGTEIDRMTQDELEERIESLRVFARVSPEHKVRIVQALKRTGNIVAMTGDGVNDAPSLKAADVGIAMGKSGTDVAKNAADIVLTDDNFATIEKAIREGRGIYENIKKSVLFLLSSNFGEIITMFLAVCAGFPVPLKASHILWVNLITDSLPALALGVDENDGENLMKKPPRGVKESLFAHGGLSCTLFYGCLIAFISLAAFLHLPLQLLEEKGLEISVLNIGHVLCDGATLARSQTYAFTVLGLSQLFHAVGMRDVEKSVFHMKHMKNKLMLLAFVSGFVLQLAVTEWQVMIHAFGTVKLSAGEWFWLVGLSAVPLFAHEILILLGKPGKSQKQ